MFGWPSPPRPPLMMSTVFEVIEAEGAPETSIPAPIAASRPGAPGTAPGAPLDPGTLRIVFPLIEALAPAVTRMPVAKPLLTFVIVLLETVGKLGCSIWIPIAVPLIELPAICTFEELAYMPTFVALRIVLLDTKLDDRTKPKPTPAWRIVLLVTPGELSVAVTARSTRSNVDQETEPDELALNWIPPQGNAVLFAVNVIALAEVPSAVSRPSTNRSTPGSNFTVVPGMIVRLPEGRIVTGPVATQFVSA